MRGRIRRKDEMEAHAIRAGSAELRIARLFVFDTARTKSHHIETKRGAQPWSAQRDKKPQKEANADLPHRHHK